jgi:small-conductance mechanosensitive channel/CRP-like cAMP-binding protein
VGAAAAVLALLLGRRALQRQAAPRWREVAGDLRGQERAFTLYLLARLAEEIYKPTSSPSLSVVHALHFCTLLFGVVGLLGLGETLFFTFLRRSTPRIVRSLVAWISTFIATAVILRTEYKFNLESLFATSALLSVVLGFALQETLGNLLSGLTLNAEQPFQPGEWVSFGKYCGRVLDVGWRSTRLITADEDELLVPNSLISREVVINHMRPQITDVIELTIGVDRDVSPARAKAVLMEAVQSCPLVQREPGPIVQLASFTPDGVHYRVKFHTEGFHVERTALDQVQEAIWYGLRRAAIDMPYPQTTVSYRERAAEAEERRRREHLAEAEDLLGRIDFVKALSEPARKTLAERARFVEYGPGQAIVKQGEQGDTLFLVARGEVGVRVRVDGAGQTELRASRADPATADREVARLGRGALFGEMSVLTGDPRTATVVAIGDAALLAVDRDAFERILGAEPELAQKLADVITRRRLALDQVRAEQQAPALEKESSNLLSRIRGIFGFRKAVG